MRGGQTGIFKREESLDYYNNCYWGSAVFVRAAYIMAACFFFSLTFNCRALTNSICLQNTYALSLTLQSFDILQKEQRVNRRSFQKLLPWQTQV